ncbi:solute carrier family 23 member 2-like [Clytia hemisphaerica]|uniref:Uncharacterized protein n=1 Tax=Clytia hemisphaerica TaxID=252671 RepID=A0A7M5XDZ8_9CNID
MDTKTEAHADSIDVQSPLMGQKVESEKSGAKQSKDELLYRIDKDPSWPLAMLLGFQHYLTMFGATVGLPFALAGALCLGNNSTIVGELISTLFFCSGLVTLLQSTFGVRLPIVQGGTYTFLAPTFAIMGARTTSCFTTVIVNATTNATASIPDPEEWKSRITEIQGAIMVSSLFQIVIGFSGIMGFVLRYIGPLTICPTIALVGLPLFGVAGNFAGTSWGVTFVTMFCITLFSQVLKEVRLPNPFGDPIPVFKLFPVLLAIIVSWALSAILTAAGIAESDKARTDYRIDVLRESDWFRVPYPGQWGTPTVNVAAVFGMLAGVLASMLESIGDYYACAKLSGAPPPPKHALNRGLGFEGLGCLITGAWGTGNGTTSYSENISAIGITRVGSLRVIRCGAMIMIVLSIIGKFGALFATVPDPVIGGIFIIMFGMITAVGLSSLQYVDLSSMRNLFVLGTSLFFGMVIPAWIGENGKSIDTGSSAVDQIIKVLLSTNMFVGGVTGFFLDNLLPGTKEERGIIKWKRSFDGDGNSTGTTASIHVYDPPFIGSLFKHRVCKYIPFLPYYGNKSDVTMDNIEDAKNGTVIGDEQL